MRRHAKAPTAGSTEPRGEREPTGHTRLASIPLAVLALALVFGVTTASAKYLSGFVGTTTTGTTGGLFNTPRSVAVNDSGVDDGNAAANGDFYVADEVNNRVQRFNADGSFDLAFGRDVVSPGGTGDANEKQTVTIGGGPSGGDFTLTFGANTTAAIPWNASAAEVDAALEAIASVGAGNVSVTGAAGGPYTVEFVGAKASVDQAQMSASGAGLTPSGTVTVATVQDGASLEVCTVAAQCKAGTTSTATLGNGGTINKPQGVEVDQDTGNVYVSDRENRRIDAFTAGGAFIRAFGFDVVASGPGNTGTGYEICAAAAGDVCKAGVAGAGVGQYASGTTANTFGIDISRADGNPSTGSVYFANSGNRRVEVYNLDGTSPSNLGTSSEFSSARPREVAVDADGILYAENSASQNAIVRYDLGTSSFLEPLEVTALSGSSSTATTGLEIARSTGNLLVARNAAVGVLEFSDPAGPEASFVGQHLDDETGIAPNGLGVNGASGDIYVPSTSGGHRVALLDDVGLAVQSAVTIDPASGVTGHCADLTGTVNSNGTTGFPARYLFQVSKNGVTWTPDAATASFAAVADDAIAHPVAGTFCGLEANTLYRVRVLTKKPANPLLSSSELTFATDAIAPEVETLKPRAPYSDVKANLLGRVNANNLATSYSFEYGETTAYGSKTPAASAGSQGTPVNVLTQIAGLKPATTYHYRVLATNPEGMIAGNDVTFTTLAADPGSQSGPCPNEELRTGLSAKLPDCRAYEMVSRPFKAARSGGYQLGGPHANALPGIPSLDGDKFLWNTLVFPLDDETGSPPFYDVIRASRGSSGWISTSDVTQIGEPTKPLHNVIIGALSPDFATQVWKTRFLKLLPDAPNGELVPYLRRDGTGLNGFSLGAQKEALLSDDGARALWWGENKGLLGATPGEDPSVNQSGGAAIYKQDDVPNGEFDLVNGCTGSGGEATELPARIGTGVATDTIGSNACESSAGSGELASGTGTITGESTTISDVVTDTGAFTIGQVLKAGEHLPSGTVVTGVGAGTLTVSSPVCVARVTARRSNSPVLTEVTPVCGQPMIGQTISGTGVPAATTIVAIDEEAQTITLSAPASGTGSDGTYSVTSPLPLVDLTSHARGVVSLGGAVAGGDVPTTAMSEDGRRIFFTAPDPAAGPTSCATATGAVTSCPPQLYVRQYDANGENPVVRWISHSRSNPLGASRYDGDQIAGQQIGLMGRGAIFQGASRDGSVVYFKTNAPLTPDDPNGACGAPCLTGSASNDSWDLYRYELPDAGDPGDGALTRVSGGPTGGADPSTATGIGTNGNARYISDDGSRVYFVTTAPIAGADTTAPHGGITTPEGTVGSNGRNLYLFDAGEAGVDRYRFIAQIPAAAGNGNTCSVSQASGPGPDFNYIQFSIETDRSNAGNSCVHGTPNGDVLAFSANVQLTAGDADSHRDIYLYDARSDELEWVSERPAGTSTPGYAGGGNSSSGFNADFGAGSDAMVNDHTRLFGWAGGRHYNVSQDADGTVSVYFETNLELLPEDTNGDYFDVYQWREGKLSLISPGEGPHDSYFSGASLDGRDVFFQTSKRIDPREIDDEDADLYDARIGGGFAYEPPKPPCDVLALKCESAAAAAPAAPGSASGSLAGAGNVTPSAAKSRCRKGKVRRGKRCVTRRCVRHRTAHGKRRCVRRKRQKRNKRHQRRTVNFERGGSK